MVARRGVLITALIFIFLFYSLSFASAVFQFNGTVKDENGNPLNNSIVNITVRNMNNWSIVGYNYTNTNSSGWFNFSVENSSALWFYEPKIFHFNDSVIAFRSKIIPAFPRQMLQMLAGTTFYLTPAGTINITAINTTGGRVLFQYQIKDTKLGYSIAEDYVNWANQAIAYVPRNRNYSIMIYPNQSMPISFNWNNFSSSSSYSFTPGSSSYNSSTYTLNKQFNISLTLARISGYIQNTSYLSWTNFTIIPYLLEPGNMVHFQYGAMPYNLSSAYLGQSDLYNLTSGFFNISLPATAENSGILLFASAQNGTNYYGGFSNLSLSYGAGPALLNITIYGLLGSANNITTNRIDGANPDIAIQTAKQIFNLVNATNASLGNMSAHIETTLDYSSYGATEFTLMSDVQQSQSVANFNLPLLNVTGIKEMNIYASGGSEGDDGQYAPKRISRTVSQIISNSNITISMFNPNGIDTQISAGNIAIGLYISNSTCDVPNPPTACILGSSQQEQNFSDFNPLQAVMGGGRISFRMGTGNISVHYVNVDLLASGPPDALFDSSASTSTTSNSFQSAIRFGSGGPTIYDYVLVSIPYSETAGSGLNDSAQVNASIPIFYDDSWNIIWNATINGSNAGALGGNYSHYSTRQSEWAYLLNSSVCHGNGNSINATNPCFINSSANRIWIRLPHFSGTGPKVTGNTVASTSSNSTDNSSSSSSSGTSGATTNASGFWIVEYSQDDKNLKDKGNITRDIGAKERMRIKIENKTHYIGVVSITATQAVINISSTPQQAIFNIGDNKKFDVSDDGFYDLQITLNNIRSLKANITISSIYEKVPLPAATKASSDKVNTTSSNGTAEGSLEGENEKSKKKTSSLALILIAIVVLLIIVGYFIVKRELYVGKLKRKVNTK